MSRKRVIIGQAEWGIHESDAEAVTGQIKAALEEDKVVALELLDGAGRQVTVYLNGKAAQSVAVDLNKGPRPSEISG